MPDLLNSTQKIKILTGPTASGKTALALKVASKLGKVEIINADSLLVFREFNIGTAKPSPEELAQVPHHLINIRDPDQTFDAADFIKEVMQAIEEIVARGSYPLIVGGSGFYLKALLFGLWKGPETQPEFRVSMESVPNAELFIQLQKKDLASAEKIGSQDRYRLIRALEIIAFSGKTPSELQAQHPEHANPLFELIVIDRDQEELEQRVIQRTQKMVAQGWIDEVKALREKYPLASALKSVGYQQICNYLDGILPAGRKLRPGLDGLIDEINLATRQLTKTQRTFYKGLISKMGGQAPFMLNQDEPTVLNKILAS